MLKKAILKNVTGRARISNATSLVASTMRDQDPTSISPSIHFNGPIRGNEDLIVRGHIEGTISIGEGLLVVSTEGRVEADVTARVIIIEGQVEGKLEATEQIIVRPSGRVRGSIRAPRITLDSGCNFNGSIDSDVGEESSSANRSSKIADFKSASTSDARTRPAREKANRNN
jgi:cytoskeletal protein CcmA (bactofilin family)